MTEYKIRVAVSPCDRCLFSKDAIPERSAVVDIVKTLDATDHWFVCHKPQLLNMMDGGSREESIACKGWYDSRAHLISEWQIAERLGWIDFVDVME